MWAFSYGLMKPYTAIITLSLSLLLFASYVLLGNFTCILNCCRDNAP